MNAQVAIATPLPNTRLRRRLEEESRLLDSTSENYTTFDVNFVPKNMTADELSEGILGIYRRLNTEEALLQRALVFKHIYRDLAEKERAPTNARTAMPALFLSSCLGLLEVCPTAASGVDQNRVARGPRMKKLVFVVLDLLSWPATLALMGLATGFPGTGVSV